MEDKHLFESVCDVLARHGFEVAPPQAAGLFVRLRPGKGLLVGWRPGRETAGPTAHSGSDAADVEVGDEFQRLRGALTLALSEVLAASGYAVTGQGVDLLVAASRTSARIPSPATGDPVTTRIV
ncbi:hypothetical protein ACFC1T_26010 [Kitasatospora sp. NPDC056076]|uniref:hypothetical protein n=1 Tax=Kitasatospora sp. NPDC056076 TaxID=3345703 RepID=UPI0035E243E0